MDVFVFLWSGGCSPKINSIKYSISTDSVSLTPLENNYITFYFHFLPGNITRLVLRSRLNLSELVTNKLFAIVFQLNYVMSEEFAKPVVVDNTGDSGVKKKRVKLIPDIL